MTSPVGSLVIAQAAHFFGATDDVVFSIQQWLDPDVGSSVLGLMPYLNPNNVEKIDNHTVRLNLDTPQLGVPEHLFHYPATVLNHRTFDGDILRTPIGTGPFVLEEWTEGERVTLKRRENYWRRASDGEALPYLDEMIFVDLGEQSSAYIPAFQGGSIDTIDFNEISDLDAAMALRNHPQANVQAVGSS